MSATAQLALEVVEAFADGQADEVQLLAAQSVEISEERNADVGIRCLATLNKYVRRFASTALSYAARSLPESERDAERAAQCLVILDVFGNPFHPVAINPAWRTPAVLALAQAAYDNRTLPAGTLEPDRLAVLADALEEAGCTNADILGHLRGPGPHVRGCFVIDTLLDKS
jgi:hypothetical protein